MNENIISNAPQMSFDGIFRFTNATNKDFTTEWNSKAYTFPAGTTVPLIIPGETPENVQNIRKLFARKLAEREFYQSARYDVLNGMSKNGTPPTFDEGELAKYIQACLEPLPESRASVVELPKMDESRFEDKVDVVEQNEDLNARAASKGKKKERVEL